MSKIEINDLRSALKVLKDIPGQLAETDVEVNPHAELSGVYRHVGAGGTVQRPTPVSYTHLRNRLIRRSRNNHRGNKRNSSKWNVCIKCRPFAAFLLEKRNRLCQRNDRLCQSFNKTTTDMVICFHKILRGINKKWRERYVRRNDAGR